MNGRRNKKASQNKKRVKEDRSASQESRNSNREENCIEEAKSSKTNDPSWYAYNEALLRDSASVAFGWPVGNRIDFDHNDFRTSKGAYESVPGIMVFDVLPTIGGSYDRYSAVNVASRNIYSFVRHANAGHSNYDAPDLMMYLLAMDSVYSMYAYLVRLYGVLQLYTVYNRYYPNALVTGMKVDYDDMINHIADLRYFINQYAVKIGSMCVPNSMSYITRHIWMFSGLYVDSPSAKAQTYMYTPVGFYVFNETEGAGKLQLSLFKDVNEGNNLTFDQLTKYAEGLVDIILASEDMNIMSGDILKAFGPEGLFKVATISEDYMVLPSYEPEVLSQLQNATILEIADTMYEAGRFDITQDPSVTGGGAILQTFRITMGKPEKAALYQGRQLLNMYKDDPTPADVMVASRLMAISTKTDGVVTLQHCGSELVVGARILYMGTDNKNWVVKSTQDFHYGMYLEYKTYDNPGSAGMTNTLAAYSKVADFISDLSRLSNFNYHPQINIGSNLSVNGAASNDIAIDGFMFDVNNYALVDEHTLAKMHETALLSEFSVPQMGAFSNKTIQK